MKTNKMVDAIGKVNDKYITEAVNYKPIKKIVYAGVAGFTALAACLLLFFGIGMFGSNNADSVISIDVNPSIELTVSKHNKVLSANALNEDALIVLGDMDFKNVDLDTALNAIMGSLLKNGYLDEIYNAVNVCVESENTERAKELGEEISGEIGSIFDENDLIGGINTQLCSIDDEAKKLADSYGISVGKLGLAQTVSENMGIPLETTVNFSIAELWDLLDAENTGIIMKDEALKIALEDAQLEESEIVVETNKIRENSGLFTYVIKFTVGEYEEYEYVIDAINKTILEREYEYNPEKDDSDDNSSAEVTTSVSEFTTTSSETTAVSETTTTVADATIDSETTTTVADTTIDSETTTTVADTTTVSDTTTTVAETTTVSETTTTVAETTTSITTTTEVKPVEPPKPEKQLTKKEALAIVCADAGVAESDIMLEELKHKPKEKEYHIEFSVGLCDYVYIINAVDGSIVRKETYDKTNADGSVDGLLPGSVISVDKALEIALNKAGVKLSELTKCDIKYTNTKESAEYKVHFHVDKDHYDYTVNALTGEIVEKAHPTPAEPLKPHEKTEAEAALKPHEKKEATTPAEPLKPHEKKEAEAAFKPHEKAEAAKPAAPTPPAGPEDNKVTITFEE